MEKTKSTNKMSAVICVFLAAILIISGFSAFKTLGMQKKLDSVLKATGTTVDTGEENGIMIMGEYPIEATTQISDAYISGDSSKLSDEDKETLEMAKAVIEKIIEPKMSDYEKEKAVYEYLTGSLKNDKSLLTVIHADNSSDTAKPHGVLKYHNAVCVGYATTMRLLLQMLGIECKVVHSSDLTHSWDLVRLDDEWYHTDCYMDAGNASFRNFNMNDETAADAGHEWSREFFPAATGTKYAFVDEDMATLKNIYQIPAWVKKALDSKKSFASCKFSGGIEKDEELAAIAMVERISAGVSMLEDYEGMEIESRWSLDDKNEYILSIFIYSYDDEEDEIKLDEEVEKKVNDALEKAFGEEFSSEEFGDFDGFDPMEKETETEIYRVENARG